MRFQWYLMTKSSQITTVIILTIKVSMKGLILKDEMMNVLQAPTKINEYVWIKLIRLKEIITDTRYPLTIGIFL